MYICIWMGPKLHVLGSEVLKERFFFSAFVMQEFTSGHFYHCVYYSHSNQVITIIFKN